LTLQSSFTVFMDVEYSKDSFVCNSYIIFHFTSNDYQNYQNWNKYSYWNLWINRKY